MNNYCFKLKKLQIEKKEKNRILRKERKENTIKKNMRKKCEIFTRKNMRKKHWKVKEKEKNHMERKKDIRKKKYAVKDKESYI